ncbi:MAG: hypothetical protein ACKO85_02795 [Isosphaeraceae bacterium]
MHQGVQMYDCDSPLAASQGRLLALEAMQKYDTTRARLQSHALNHMQGLRRINRQQSEVMTVPERVLQEIHKLKQYTQENDRRTGTGTHRPGNGRLLWFE